METVTLTTISPKMLKDNTEELANALNNNFKILQKQNSHLIKKCDSIEKGIKDLVKELKSKSLISKKKGSS